jgi:hypothetical protein
MPDECARFGADRVIAESIGLPKDGKRKTGRSDYAQYLFHSGKGRAEVYSQLGRFRYLKEQNPDLIIGVVGCLAQHLGNKFHKRMDYLDFVCGTHKSISFGNHRFGRPDRQKSPGSISSVVELDEHFCSARDGQNQRLCDDYAGMQ